jgi:hypothetical protein
MAKKKRSQPAPRVKPPAVPKATSPKRQPSKSQEENDPPVPVKVFLCHSSGDKAAVRRLYASLEGEGFTPWLDEEDILPGQNWNREIRKAVRASHVVVVCLSKSSITKEGYVQKEIRLALDVAQEKPEGTIFLIPARLELCDVPDGLEMWHRVDLFDGRGLKRLVQALHTRQAQLRDGLSQAREGRIGDVAKLVAGRPAAVRRAMEALSEAPFPILKDDLVSFLHLDDGTGDSLWIDPIFKKLVRSQTVNEMTWLAVATPQIAESLRGPERPPSIEFRQRITEYTAELGIRILKSMRSLNVSERDRQAYRLAMRLATYRSALLASEEISRLWSGLWDRVMKDVQGGRSSSLYALLVLAKSPAFSIDEPTEPLMIEGYSLENAIGRLSDILKDRTFVQPELAAVLLGFLSWRDGRATVLEGALRELDLSATAQATTLARVADQTRYALRKNRNPLLHVDWSA